VEAEDRSLAGFCLISGGDGVFCLPLVGFSSTLRRMVTSASQIATQVDLGTMPADVRDRGHWVRYQLRLRGLTFGGIARELHVSRGTVRKAVLVPYPKMETAIAEKLGLRPAQIWPERYDGRGRPRRSLGSLHSTHPATLPKDARRANGKDRGRA
jgi:Ner family transcriptional regulator